MHVPVGGHAPHPPEAAETFLNQLAGYTNTANTFKKKGGGACISVMHPLADLGILLLANHLRQCAK